MISLAILGSAFSASNSFAGAPHFPWHKPHHGQPQAPAGPVPVQVLAHPATAPIDVLAPKQAYPYGWFGSNPAPQWKRSFGVSKAYTQWSRY